MKSGWCWMLTAFLLSACAAASAGGGVQPAATQPRPLKFSNPPQGAGGPFPVVVTFALEGEVLLARFRVTTDAIFARRTLAHDEYPYQFDVVELFVRNAKSPHATYYEFEVSPYDQVLQVNVVEPHQQYTFGVRNGFSHNARIIAGGWEAEMAIPLATLGWDGRGPVELIGNAYAALGEGDRRIYWSLFELPPGKPDFHMPGAFKALFVPVPDSRSDH